MSDPNTTGGAPQSGAVPPASGPLPVRKLTQPYFDVRPNNQFTYFVPEYLRVVKSDAEPLARFLADARLEPGSRPDQRRIEYSLGAIPADQIRPLEFLAKAEVEAFEAAARQFYVAAHQDQRVPMAEKEARKSFRLPDPDKEPDAYWVYGHQYDPKLLILWGAEKERNSALPLVEDPEVVPRNAITLAQKLRKRLLPWEKKKKQVIEMIKARNEPLARFIEVGEPIFDKKTQKLTGIKTPDGQTRPVKDWRRLNRNLNAAEVKAFEAAAKTFYDRAHPAGTEGAPDEGEVTPYERELRQDFRLPDPDSHPDAYWVYGSAMSSKLMVLCRCTEQQGECLPLVVDEVLKLPEDTGSAAPAPGSAAFADANKGEQLAGLAGKTVAGKLAKHKKSPMATVIRAGVGAAIVLIALAGWKFVVATPPKIAESPKVLIDAKIDPDFTQKKLEVVFDKSLNTNSIAEPGKSAATGVAPDNAQFRILPDEAKLAVVKVTLLDSSKKRFLLEASGPFKEGTPYTLLVDSSLKSSLGVAVKKGTQKAFEYKDTIPARIIKAAPEPASDRKIRVSFSEKVKPDSARNPVNYVLKDSSGAVVKLQGTPELLSDGDKVILTSAEPLKNKAEYRIVTEKIADLSNGGNADKMQSEYPFPFVEPAPAISAVRARGVQTEAIVEFDRPVDKDMAANKANYTLEGSSVEAAELLADGKTVRLKTAPMRKAGNYKLIVNNLKGVVTAPGGVPAVAEGPVERPFPFEGSEDNEGPKFVKDGVTYIKTPAQLVLTFDEPIKADSIKSGAFDIGRPVKFDAVPGSKPTEVVLKLESELAVGSLRISYDGLEDAFSNRGKDNIESTVKGVTYKVTIANARFEDSRTVLVIFSQPLAASSVQTNNFKIRGSQVTATSLGADGKRVRLVLAGALATNTPPVVSCSNVRSQIAVDAQSDSFESQ